MKYLGVTILLLWTSLLYSQSNKNLYLGVLETRWPGNNHEIHEDSTRIKTQRVLFRFQDNKWYSLENDIGNPNLYPSQENWYITFDGKIIGEFSSTKAPLRFKDSPWTYPRDAFHIPQNNNLPTVGKPSMEFSGWDGGNHPRPLVTISDANYIDPEKWKPYNPEKIEMEVLKSVYMKHVIILKLGWVDTVYDYKLRFGKSYISSNSDKLIQIGLIDSINGQEYLSNKIWIYKSKYGEIVDLSKAVDLPFKGSGDSEISSLNLVDAGDYDQDGYSDVLFWIDRYNGNGYALFYNNFSSYVSFEWSYH